PRPARQTFHGRRHAFTVAKGTTGALQALGRREGWTFFMMALGAFQILLSRCSRQDDVVVGTPVANRGRPELEPLIAPFLNTIVLRADLAGNPTFRELMGRVREMALSAFEHQEMPFEQLVVELRPERDLSRNPLFQVLFNVLNDTELPRLGDVVVEPIT